MPRFGCPGIVSEYQHALWLLIIKPLVCRLQYNEFQRTVIYAVSLGGDTDTIASMAGAIAGACYGIESIPTEWSDACEATHTAKQLADKMYEIVSAGHDGTM